MPLPDYMPVESTATKTNKKKGAGGGGVSKIVDALNQLPLPTQGNVADLVDLVSFPHPEQPLPSQSQIQMVTNTAVENQLRSEDEKEAKDQGSIEDQILFGARIPPTLVRRRAAVERVSDKPPPQFISVPSPMALGPGVHMTSSPNPAYAEWVKAKTAQDRQDRIKANNADLSDTDRGPEKAVRGQVEQMSWDEYNSLSDQQRAAVDFNSLLVQAVRRDKKMNRLGEYDDVTDQQRKTYDIAEKRLFGENLGSDKFAPETLALMEQLDLVGSGSDFDDFLKLRVAITDDDLKLMKNHPFEDIKKTEKLVAGFDRAEKDRFQQVWDFAGNTLEMQQTMAQTGALLDTFRKTAAIDRERQLQVGEFGGTPMEPKVGLGFMEGQRDAQGYPLDLHAYFQDRYDMLADRSGQYDSNQVLAAVRDYLNPAQLQEFYDYVNIRSENAERFSIPLGTTEGIQYRTPEEFRQLLGIAGKG